MKRGDGLVADSRQRGGGFPKAASGPKQPTVGRAGSRPAAAAAPRPTPTAPTVYRPNAVPKVLQRKSSAPQPAGLQPPRAPTLKPAAQSAQLRQPQPAHKHARPSAAAAPPRPTRQQPPAQARAVRPAGAVQPAASKRGAPKSPAAGVVQAIKLYPNLHPGAVERVEQDSVFKLSNFADQYRLRKTQTHGVYVPNQLYNFVRTSEGEMLLHNRYRHPSIAEGRQVLYAGEAYFNNGKLEWWSNGSGHYQPDSEDAQQAALPMDHFYSYQQVIKGEHKRRRG
jgi:hypothetical protein